MNIDTMRRPDGAARTALTLLALLAIAVAAVPLASAVVHDDLGTSWPADLVAVSVLAAGVVSLVAARRPSPALVVVLVGLALVAAASRALPAPGALDRAPAVVPALLLGLLMMSFPLLAGLGLLARRRR